MKILKKILAKNSIDDVGIVEAWKKEQKREEFKFMSSNPKIAFLVILFIISDLMFIHQLIEAYFYDTEVMGWFTSIVVAVLIDVSPSTIASGIERKNKSLKHYFAIAISVVALILGFVILAYIRIHSSDIIFSVESTSLISSQHGGGVQKGRISRGMQGMTWLFILIPIFTSILSFTLTMLCESDAEKTLIDRMKGYNLYNEISESIADSMEMKQVMDTDFEAIVDKKYNIAILNIETDAQVTMDTMKLMQAIACGGSPEVHRILRSEVKMQFQER